MKTNIDRYKEDLNELIEKGELVRRALLKHALGEKKFLELLNKEMNNDAAAIAAYTKGVGDFRYVYQSWYTEALALVKQLAPERMADLIRHYEKPKGRKAITYESYRIEDALQNLRTTRLGETVVDAAAALPHMEQQLAIVSSMKRRFDSSLFEIRQLVQADLFDSELDSARELLKNKFFRAAGAVAGVVLEKHLAQTCQNHQIAIRKKNPGISDLNDALKGGDAIDVPTWRFVQHLGDYRNLCDHNKGVDPTKEQVHELIEGVSKVTKTIF